MNHPIDLKKETAYDMFSRRDFMKYTGTIIFVMGSGGYLYAEKSPGSLTKVGAKSAGIPPSRGYLLVDTRKCQSCMSCMLACTLVHEGVENPSLSRIQIIQNPFESFPADVTIEQCRQCVEPACVEACPENALVVNADFGNVRTVNKTKCTGCGECQLKCPSKKIPSEFDRGLNNRTAIYIPFPQAVPARPVIDREHCIYYKKGKCKACEKVCPADAVDFEQVDEYVEEEVGGIVVATGFDLYTTEKQGPYPDYSGYGEYGYGEDPDIMRKQLTSEVAMGRIGIVDDIAHIVAMLVSERGRYTTGTAIQVDGGLFRGLR